MIKKRFIFLLGFVLVTILGTSMKIDCKPTRFSNEHFTITYPHSWKLSVLSDKNISIVHPDSKFRATDYIFDTDFADITIRIIRKNELKNFIVDRIPTYKDPDLDAVQSTKKKTVQIKKKSVLFYYWTTENTNGLDSYLEYDASHYIFFKMIYGNQKKRYFEEEFFRVVESYRIQ